MLLNHETKTIVPTKFIELGLVDVSYNNDECGSMIHPKLEDFIIYPCADYTEVVFGEAEIELEPKKWFISNLNCPEDSLELTPDEVVEFYAEKLKEEL